MRYDSTLLKVQKTISWMLDVEIKLKNWQLALKGEQGLDLNRAAPLLIVVTNNAGNAKPNKRLFQTG